MPAHDCGHACCTVPDNPRHTHRFRPEDCPGCAPHARAEVTAEGPGPRHPSRSAFIPLRATAGCP